MFSLKIFVLNKKKNKNFVLWKLAGHGSLYHYIYEIKLPVSWTGVRLPEVHHSKKTVEGDLKCWWAKTPDERGNIWRLVIWVGSAGDHSDKAQQIEYHENEIKPYQVPGNEKTEYRQVK